ncbi:unnamed protein product [Ectocarpus sp. 12 AP-2014]
MVLVPQPAFTKLMWLAPLLFVRGLPSSCQQLLPKLAVERHVAVFAFLSLFIYGSSFSFDAWCTQAISRAVGCLSPGSRCGFVCLTLTFRFFCPLRFLCGSFYLFTRRLAGGKRIAPTLVKGLADVERVTAVTSTCRDLFVVV